MEKLSKFVQNIVTAASDKLFQKFIWHTPVDQNKPFRLFLIRQIRILVLALQNALNNKIFMLAPALTFFSVLSVVLPPWLWVLPRVLGWKDTWNSSSGLP